MLDSLHYLLCIIIMMIGFYGVTASGNAIKQLIGLGIFQTSVLLFYISAAYINDGAAPILDKKISHYVNPLPHVLMLTAIVVGVATLAVGLAIAVRLKEAYGTIEEEIMLKQEAQDLAKQRVQDKTHD